MSVRRSDPALRRLTPDDRRQQILATARELLGRHAIDELSVEVVAKEAGVSAGLLFHYFGSQNKFRQAVVQRAAEELLSHLAPDPALSPAEQLRSGIETFVTYVGRHPAVYLAVVRFSKSGNDLGVLHRTVRATLAQWILTGLEQSGLPAIPTVSMTIAGWLAFMEEAVLDWLDKRQITREELVTLCERSAYQLVAAALDDPERWEKVRAAMQQRH
jgi:AcrR family transcriptional regulator